MVVVVVVVVEKVRTSCEPWLERKKWSESWLELAVVIDGGNYLWAFVSLHDFFTYCCM